MKVPSALAFADGAPRAGRDHQKARGAPTYPSAPSHQLLAARRGLRSPCRRPHRQELNATFLFADADVVFLRDPLPYLRRQLELGAQLLFHTDGFGPSAHALAHPDALELPSHGWGRAAG